MPNKRKATSKMSNKQVKKQKTNRNENDEVEEKSSEITVQEPSKSFNLKIISWNVNGIRAGLKNGIMSYLESEDCDILCLQETKCNSQSMPSEIKNWNKFSHKYFSYSKQDGYAGVALFSKVEPLKVDYGIGNKEFDDEGRIITAHYDNFILVNAYVVNAGQGLKRLDYKLKFDEEFREYLQRMDAEKPVILCGDLNVAHKEIDLENPKTNLKTAGFTVEERADFTTLLNAGFIDSYRLLYPTKRKAYTYWGYRFNCRAKDIGWRLDYFVISNSLEKNLVDNQIAKHIMGSDHCPIILYMDL